MSGCDTTILPGFNPVAKHGRNRVGVSRSDMFMSVVAIGVSDVDIGMSDADIGLPNVGM